MTIIYENIKAARLTARKARDENTSGTLAVLLGDLEREAKDQNREVTDKAAVSKLKKYLENAREMAVAFGDRRDSENLDRVEAEIEVYESLLPAVVLMSEVELLKAVAEAIDGGATKVGDIMKVLKAKYDGKYDGAMASRIAKAAAV